MHAENSALRRDQMYICMALLFIHLSQGRKELLEMLRRCRITMRGLGSVYKSHSSPVNFQHISN